MMRIETSTNIVLLPILLCAAVQLNATLLTSAKLSWQSNEKIKVPPLEEIYLHVDREMYIAGEDMWLSIYAIDGKTGKQSDRSAIAYIEVLNPWNIPIIQRRYQLIGGRGEGSFLFPDSISSGTYTVRAYTNWMKNFLPDNCFMYNINIYNPFKGSYFIRKFDSADISNRKLISPPDNNENTVNIMVDSIYGRREKVQLKVQVRNDKAERSGISEMSISVTPSEVSPDNPWRNDFIVSATDLKQYSFEGDGHYLSGRIKYSNGNITDRSDFLYMSIQGKVAEFNYAEIDSAGRFSFVLPVDSKNRNLILQPEHATNKMSLEIESSFSWKLAASYCYKDTLSHFQLDVFSTLSFNYQAAKIYGIISRKEAEKDDPGKQPKRRFYGIPEMEIFLDDYIKLPSVQEIFFELVPGIILRSRQSGYEIKITNPLTGIFYEEPPLVMIDGVIINDLTVLVDLDPEIIEKIEVVKTPYLIGDLILHGIVNVITRSGDFSKITMPDYAVILPYRVVDESPSFTSPDYSDELIRQSRKPDLRNTLYWNPSVKTDMNGDAELEFWTSDLPGNYKINIQGISDTGEKLSISKSFLVR